MATYDDILPELRMHAKQCPDITLTQALKRAVREFCRETWVYQKTLLLDVVQDQSQYPLSLTTDDEVVHIDAVEYDDMPLYPVGQKDYSSNSTGDPSLYQFEPPNILLLSPIPSEDEVDGLKVRLVLQPSETTSTVPDAIYRNWKPDVAYGAAYFVLSMPAELWTNFALAQQMFKLYWQGLNKAKGARMFHFKRRNHSIRPRSFAI